MAQLDIRTIGDPVLRSKAKKINEINNKTKEFIENMVDTMYENNGIGLAAPQVGVLQRIVVIDIGEGKIIKIINPEILKRSNDKNIREEGCLSVPGKTGPVLRATEVIVKGLDVEGEEVTYNAKGLLARAFQHEIDHLQGKLFVDKIIDIDE